MKMFKCILVLILATVILSSNVKDNRIFTATDLHKLARLSSTTPTPDGKWLVYSLRNFDFTTKKASTHLEYVELSTGKVGKLTDPTIGATDFNPTFSKGFGNTCLFLSSRSGSVQVWSVDVPSQVTDTIPEAKKLTNYPIDINSFKLSWESGNSLVFSADVYVDCLADLACTANKDAEIAKRGTNTWATYDKLMMRHWDKWLSDKVGHILVQKLKSHISIINDKTTITPQLDGDPLELMLGMKTNSPVGPFGGSEMYDVSPDGTEVAYTGADRTDDEAWNTGWKIYVSTVGDKSVSGTHLTSHIKARTTQPKYSSDGSLLGYLAMDREGLESDKLHLEIYNKSSKNFKNITGSYDRSLNDFQFVDNNTAIFTSTDYGNTKLFFTKIRSLSSDNSHIVKLNVQDFYSNGAVVKIPGTNSFAVERSSYQDTSNIWILNYDTKTFKQLTDVNPVLKDFELTPAESFIFPGGNGDDVQGFIFRPVKFNSRLKYPLAFLIHGGPEGAWESDWSYRWNVQLWINRGYAVVVVNPHGSTGMGQRFTDLVRDDWGGLPYQDLMNGFDFVKKTYPWVDTGRSCAVGASYGGYMVNWIQGQTDRFSCLVTHDGVFSTLTMFYATEELWFPMAEYCPLDKVGCKPYNKEWRERYFKFSPESYVQNWKTPHLVIHGSNDLRIPVSEGISVFTALQLKNIPSKFIHFTEENHWVLKPENSVKWYDEVLSWMDTYTKNTPPKSVQKLLK